MSSSRKNQYFESDHFSGGGSNAIREMDGGSTIDAADTKLVSVQDDWKGEVGLGFTRSFDNDAFSLYGEVNAGTSLQNFGDSNELKGNAGARIKF